MVRKCPYFDRHLLPHVYLWAFMLAYTVVVVHVQIINRLFMFMPIVNWFQAHLYYQAGALVPSEARFFRYLHVLLLGTYSVVMTVLFLSFYPPA